MNNNKKKVAFYTLGCKLNFAETSAISRSFPEDCFEKVPVSERADIYVINTCTVTGAADKKCRQAIRKFSNRFPEAFIAVIGCYSQLNPGMIASIPGVDLILGTNEKFDILSYINNTGKRKEAEIHACILDPTDEFYPSFSVGDRTRSFLKVQDGCDYHCSYCTVPLARGKSRNPSIRELLSEAESISRVGVREIVLTGVNIGDFGKSTGETLIGLLRELIEIEGIQRYRISSIEPDLLIDELISLTASNKKILPHFHIPLQSGNNKILGLMKRRYRRELFADKVGHIRDLMPLAGIGVDVIAGFPGETDSDFEDTLSFLEKMPLSYMHVFNFAERPGTNAATLTGKIPFSIRENRSKRLISLSGQKHEEFCRINTGCDSEVLFEHARVKGMITGFTENYIRTELPWDEKLAGRIIKVRLDGVARSGRMSSSIM